MSTLVILSWAHTLVGDFLMLTLVKRGSLSLERLTRFHLNFIWASQLYILLILLRDHWSSNFRLFGLNELIDHLTLIHLLWLIWGILSESLLINERSCWSNLISIQSAMINWLSKNSSLLLWLSRWSCILCRHWLREFTIIHVIIVILIILVFNLLGDLILSQIDWKCHIIKSLLMLSWRNYFLVSIIEWNLDFVQILLIEFLLSFKVCQIFQ